MCLYIEKDAVAAVAEEDIEVYKVLRYMDGEYDSPYQEYVYPLGVNPPVVHESMLGIYKKVLGAIDDTGMTFFYLTYSQAVVDTGYTEDNLIRVMVVEEGLHTFASLDEARDFESYNNKWNTIMRVVRCIIPKGAEYYKGIWTYTNGGKHKICESYASSQLIALDVVPTLKEELLYDTADTIP